MGFRPILSKLCNFEVLLSTVCVCAHNTTITKRLDESRKNTTTMTTPRNEMIGRVVDIVGIAIGDRGRSCEQHVAYCGVVLAPDVLLRLMKEEIFVNGKVETVVSAYWVTDSVERCRVGFASIDA